MMVAGSTTGASVALAARLGLLLGSRGGGRRRGGAVRQLGLLSRLTLRRDVDRVVVLLRRLLEVTDPLAERVAELRDLVRAEDQHEHDEDDQYFRQTESHGGYPSAPAAGPPRRAVDMVGARGDRPLVLGHRGASGEAPENTVVAFRMAVEQGADGVELDVWRCGTGEVVVHHDPDARRPAGAAVRITTASLRQLRSLDGGAWKGETFRGERIPTLREVAEALPGSVLNVELKSSGMPDLGLPGAVFRVLRDARALDRCVVSSFDY